MLKYAIILIACLIAGMLSFAVTYWVANAPHNSARPADAVIIMRPTNPQCEGRDMAEDEYLDFRGNCVHIDEIVSTII